MEHVDKQTSRGDYRPRRSRLIRRVLGNKMLLIGGVVLLAMISTGLLAPLLAVYDPHKMDFSAVLVPPSFSHLMGTDHFGRDIFSRIVYGTRVSIKVGVASILIGFVGGIIIGAVAGYFSGLLDDLLMRMMDGLLAFPALLLAIGLVASMGPSLKTVCLSIGIVYIPRFARVMRSSVLAEKEKEYVEAARAIGQSNFKILLKHIGPNCISPVLVMATVIFALAIIIEATLSFLGIGLPPPTPSWGSMLNESRRYLGTSIYPALFPGLVISFAVLGLNLLGDGLRDLLDPKIYTVK